MKHFISNLLNSRLHFALICFSFSLAGIFKSPTTCTAQESCYVDGSCNYRHWPATCTSGRSQSPISLPYCVLKFLFAQRVTLVQNSYYHDYHNFNLTNTGHTVQAYFNHTLTSNHTLEGSLLRQQYIFSHMEFHWGSDNNRGSEHQINLWHYPMEAHLIHHGVQYKNFSDAVNSTEKGAVAVIAVLFARNSQDNPGLIPIIRAMENVRHANTTINSTNLRLASFLPQSQNVHLIQYYGSLTSPNCTEGVLWNVIANPVQISDGQLDAFRTRVLNYGRQPLVNNYRPIQSSNGRTLTYLNAFIS